MARHHYETLQQVFDDAYRGLAAQGFRQSIKDGICAYRGHNGMRCAIGHCITDDRYNPELEGLRPEHVVVRIGRGVFNVPAAKLTDLQKAHDFSPSPERMVLRLADFAGANGLTIPSIEGAA